MTLGLQQQGSDLAFAQSTTTNDGSTTVGSEFAPAPEHRHAAWTGHRAENSRSKSHQNMTAQNVEAEERPPYLHVRYDHHYFMLCITKCSQPVLVPNALTRVRNHRP